VPKACEGTAARVRDTTGILHSDAFKLRGLHLTYPLHALKASLQFNFLGRLNGGLPPIGKIELGFLDDVERIQRFSDCHPLRLLPRAPG
jgi:hypothetical protein